MTYTHTHDSHLQDMIIISQEEPTLEVIEWLQNNFSNEKLAALSLMMMYSFSDICAQICEDKSAKITLSDRSSQALYVSYHIQKTLEKYLRGS